MTNETFSDRLKLAMQAKQFKLHTAPLGRSDQIDLLELFRLHGQFQTVGKGFICHRKSP